MPLPTHDLQASRHLGLSCIILLSFILGSLRSSPPRSTDTAHVRHSPPLPQLPLFVPFPSYLRASSSLSTTPRCSMAVRRLSPGRSRITRGSSPCDGGYRSSTRTSGRRLIRLSVSRTDAPRTSPPSRSASESAESIPTRASTVRSYPRHSVATVVTSTLPPDRSTVSAAEAIESPYMTPSRPRPAAAADALSAFPPATSPETMTIPSPSSLPPSTSRSSIPRPGESGVSGTSSRCEST
mmetsp:Transcript_4190/g.9381  ORF Transcript_4190/g.9381 Transcript_4190/m.9381 type:complete len:239 (-) Transcript_4190:401-1117(-)